MTDGSLPHPPRRRRLGSRRRHEDAMASWSERAVARIDELSNERDEQREKLREMREQLRFLEDQRLLLEDAEEVLATAASRAEQIESAAHARARELEHRAQEHAVRMVQHVVDEAGSILQHARDESASLRSRTEASLASSTTRVEQLGHVQLDVARSIRTAMHRFEEGLVELESTAPSRRFLPTVDALEQAEVAAAQAQQLTWPVDDAEPTLLSATRSALTLSADTSAPARPFEHLRAVEAVEA